MNAKTSAMVTLSSSKGWPTVLALTLGVASHYRDWFFFWFDLEDFYVDQYFEAYAWALFYSAVVSLLLSAAFPRYFARITMLLVLPSFALRHIAVFLTAEGEPNLWPPFLVADIFLSALLFLTAYGGVLMRRVIGK
jgi:hypothetical protein